MSTLRRRIMVLGGGDIGGYVDLGLPSGLVWAKGNIVPNDKGGYKIGEETDYGGYFSWGNIVPHFSTNGSTFDDGYDFGSGTGKESKYAFTPGYSVSANIPSNDAAHDAALALLGSPWHLPTKENFQELYDNTDREWTTLNGVKGLKFMKKTVHSLYVFFPAAGSGGDTSLSYRGTNGGYWSASLYSRDNAYRMYFTSSSVYPQNNYARYRGFSVRPVCKPMYSITITIEGEDVEGITVTVRDSEGISHSGTTDSNGVVQLTGVYSGYASVFTKDYYVTNGHITVNASSRTFTCGLEQRESKYLTFYSITDCTHKFSKAVNYSLDGGTTWQSLAANTNLTVTAGNSVMWKAALSPGTSGVGKFSVKNTSMRFDVEGNPMSLLYGDNFIGQTDLTSKSYAFSSMFSSNKGVVNARNIALPATTLANYCYQYMFSSCTSLISVPELSATTLANNCCYYMFQSCTSLTSVPNNMLPATTLAYECYADMFYGCKNMTSAPTLPATTLAERCYESMFSGCSSLTTAPELHATTLAELCCIYMFANCTSLTTAPVLPATTLVDKCYYLMFYGCTSLTTAPELPATTLAENCYYQMFKGCTSLNYIKCMASDISARSCTYGWVENVAASGTFYKEVTANFTTGNNGIPSGWTVIEAPSDYLTFTASEDGTFQFSNNGLSYSTDKANWTALSANTPTPTVSAGDSIYFKGTMTPVSSSGIGKFSSTGNFTVSGNAMSLLYGDNYEGEKSLSGKSYALYTLFSDCTKLTDASELILPATTLASYCYERMFYGCTSLTTAPVLPATTLTISCYSWMFCRCTSLTTAPVLPATTLVERCYANMFQSCTSLTTAPKLYATTLAQLCYAQMFYGCTSLNYIKCMAYDISAEDCLTYWVYNVAASGTFVKYDSMTEWPTGVSGIPSGWTVQNAW